MTKIFISCPMRGLTTKQIETLRKLMLMRACKAVYGRSKDHEFEIIDSVVEKSDEPSKSSMRKLGRSIQLMDDADFFISPSYMWSRRNRYYGCYVEAECWSRYKINPDDEKTRLTWIMLTDEDMDDIMKIVTSDDPHHIVTRDFKNEVIRYMFEREFETVSNCKLTYSGFVMNEDGIRVYYIL